MHRNINRYHYGARLFMKLNYLNFLFFDIMDPLFLRKISGYPCGVNV